MHRDRLVCLSTFVLLVMLGLITFYDILLKDNRVPLCSIWPECMFESLVLSKNQVSQCFTFSRITMVEIC